MKALPQPSARYGETVCCAGVTQQGLWKRLYPIRFRHLSGESSFGRWDQVSFKYSKPVRDKRVESCHVYEDTIEILGQFPQKERARAFNPLIVSSVAEASRRGQSLALIRPEETRFIFKRKSNSGLAEERIAYSKAARQGLLFDKELDQLEPSPYEFRFKFRDAEAEHTYANGDWEAHAMFYRGTRSGKSDKEVLDWMDHTFNVEYPAKGMAFAVGNQAKRPQVWQLLGVLRLDKLSDTERAQGSLF